VNNHHSSVIVGKASGSSRYDPVVHRPSVKVTGLGHYVPEKIVTNADLAELMDTNDEWIRTRTGICERRMADISQSTSDLAVEASKEALRSAGIGAQDIDLIVVSTITPDYYMPGIGVLIQDKLKAPPVMALDIRGQCAGFTWCLATADGYARLGGMKNILVVGADLQTRILDYSDAGRNTAVLFGDGAGALILRVDQDAQQLATVDNTVSGLIDHELGSDGSGCLSLYVKRPGMMAGKERFMTTQDMDERSTVPHMDGRQVFKHATLKMESLVRSLCKKHGITPDDIDVLIPHQANFRINEMVRGKLGLPHHKVVNVIDKYGNTTSATLPLCMAEAQKDGRLVRGKLVMTVAFGSGFSWGANLLRW